jgi:hypothetical protein
VPSVREVLGVALLWALVAWLAVTAWGVVAQGDGPVEAAGRYYAIRAPFVGLVAGLAGSPFFALHPAGRGWRRVVRLAMGVVGGLLLGGVVCVGLLALWPKDNPWNTLGSAFNWSLLFWRGYWWLFGPLAAAAGVASQAITRLNGIQMEFP